MTPHLTATGRIVLVAAATLILAGVVSTRWTILLFGECLAVMLTVSYYLQLAPLLAIEEGFLRARVRSPNENGSPGGVAGKPISIEVDLLNRTTSGFLNVRLSAEHSGGLTLDPPYVHVATVRAHERLTLKMSVCSASAGRHMVHGFRIRVDGFLGLVAVSDYIPTSLPLKFIPAATAGWRRLPQTTQRSTDVQQIGVNQVRRRGFGTDFRELRDHAIGDPFRSIAWKATARTGKLMVRQFEDEVIANAFVLLDVSSTMRGGAPPKTKLAHSVELISAFAQTLARSQDRVGLITFDEVVYGHVRTGSARALLPQITNHLVGLFGVTDPDFTELDDDEVLAETVRYLMVQERLDFRKPELSSRGVSSDDPYDKQLLEYWLDRVLRDEEGKLDDGCFSAGVIGHDDLSTIRRFCQLRSVPVPYRLAARFGAKEQGVVKALERFLLENRESHFVLLVTDLCGLVDIREITAALEVVLSRKHRVTVLMPYTPDYISPPDLDPDLADDYDRDRVLYEIFRLAERRERSRLARSISSLGIPVICAGPGDQMDAILQKIRLHRGL